MRCAWVSLCLVLLVTAPLFDAAAQSTAAPAARQQSPQSDEQKLQIPCYAKEIKKAKTFSGFWNPRPANEPGKQVTIIIGFHPPDPESPFDCVGEPLQVAVPNGQIVNLMADNWMEGCTPTFNVTPAVADSTIADLLTLFVKVGAVGAVRAEPTRYRLPALKNKVLNVTVVCKIPKTDETPVRSYTQSAIITYQNPPRVAVSAGLLVSAEGVTSYTILTTKTGVNSSGTSTSQTSIGISGDSSAQVIPFGFVNLYLAGSRKLNLSSQFGIGVNPNLSTAKVEFFAAPLALAWHDFYFAPGIHFGQHEKLTGGFLVGDVVTGLSKPPIGWHYETGLAFSLSYNLKPLVKPSAASPTKGN